MPQDGGVSHLPSAISFPVIRFALGFLPLPSIGLAAAILLFALAPVRWAEPISLATYAAALGAAGMAWRFRLGNLTLLALAIGAGHFLLERLAPGQAADSVLYHGTALYLAAALGLFVALPERGLGSQQGVARCFLAAMPAAAIYAYQQSGFPSPGWLRWRVLPFDLWPGIPELAQLAALASLVAFVWRFVRRPSPIESGATGALIAVLLALAHVEDRLGRTVFMAAAAAIMLAALVQNGYRVAFLDELTGIPGRRALKSLCAGLGRDYVIAMVDIDHFKKFNDTYGHDVGDQVLCRVATVLAGVTGGGRAFRYGGEEFTVVFAGRRIAEAMPHLEALRKAVAGTPFEIRGKDRPEEKPDAPKPKAGPAQTVQITVSIGVAEKTDAQDQWEEVMKVADEALYRAKQAGRNRVSL